LEHPYENAAYSGVIGWKEENSKAVKKGGTAGVSGPFWGSECRLPPFCISETWTKALHYYNE